VIRPKGVRRLFHMRRRGWIEEAVDEEFEHHLAMRVDELVEEGMRPEEARRVAEAAFGNRRTYRGLCLTEQRREERMTKAWEVFGSVRSDVGYALRGFRKAPGFTAAIVLTLVVDTLLLRDVAFERADEVHQVYRVLDNGFALPDLRPEEALALDEVQRGTVVPFLSGRLDAVRSDGPEPRMLNIEALEPGFTDMLGRAPILGRPLNPEDARPGARPVALLSHAFWMNELGGDPEVVGREIVLDDIAHEAIGVLPRDFRYPLYGTTDLYVALADDGTALRRPLRAIAVTLRVPEGESERITGALLSFVEGHVERRPGSEPWSPRLHPLNGDRGNSDVRQALLVSAGAVFLMLLVALVNGVNLMLVRSASRSREIEVRQALGGSRGRIVRQLVTESLVLSLMSAMVAVALAAVGVEALWAMAPRDLTFWAPAAVEIDGRVLGFVALAALAVGLMLGIVPALRGVSEAAATPGRPSRAGGARVTRARSPGLLVVFQVATSLVLMFGAALLGRSFSTLVGQDPGMEVEGLLSVSLELSPARYPSEEAAAGLVAQVRERLQAIPGVTAATWGHYGLPASGITFGEGLYLEGSNEPLTPETLVMPLAEADATLRVTMGTPLLGGRDFAEDDLPEDRRLLVTASLARRLGAAFPADAVGVRFRFGPDGSPWEVIGVIEDARLEGLDPLYGREAFLRLADPESPGRDIGFLLRVDGPMGVVQRAVREAIHEIDPGQPISELTTVADQMRASVRTPKFFMTLMIAFALAGLTLAGLGLYGVLSYAVSQRTREVGIRLALGAATADVRSMILQGGLVLGTTGTLIGVAASLYLGRLLEGLLYETSPRDLGALAATGAFLLAVAALASYLPARRATRVDPVEALRSE
jgi:putative ABC transport system permease protein